MSVTVQKLPRPPKVTGNSHRDLLSLHKYMEDIFRSVNQLRERTGGTTDNVAGALDTANTASNTAAASQAGATIPTEGGAITLNPANPLSYTLFNNALATINVAGHTRTGAAAPLVAANVSPNVARDNTYYVYYSDAGDLGGAQTFLAATALATVTGTVGYRIIGTIFIPAFSYGDRDL